jgi:hypothetical protein
VIVVGPSRAKRLGEHAQADLHIFDDGRKLSIIRN